jgi:trehalose 6-phosphate phosphatase
MIENENSKGENSMLSEELLHVLKQKPLGLLFDIDGTLSPIAPTPGEAYLYPGTADLLRKVSQYAHVGIVTGRAVEDGARIVNVKGLTYIGNHGLEWCNDLPDDSHQVQVIPDAIPYVDAGKHILDFAEKELLPEFPDIIIQRKSVGGSLHYRLVPNPEQARERILAMLAKPVQTVHMRLGEGKRVIEVLAPLNENKGRSLRRYVEQIGLQGVLFAGDDRTDVFAIDEIARLRQEGLAAFSVGVKHADTPADLLQNANQLVQGVEEMAHLLTKITDMLSHNGSATA